MRRSLSAPALSPPAFFLVRSFLPRPPLMFCASALVGQITVMRTGRKRGADLRVFTKEVLAHTVMDRLKEVGKLEGSVVENEKVSIITLAPVTLPTGKSGGSSEKGPQPSRPANTS